MSASRRWLFRKNPTAYDLELVSDSFAPAALGDHEIRVRVRAVSLNYRDLVAWRNLAGRAVDGRTPASDGAGEVVEVGAKVTQWTPGDRVAGCFFPNWQSGPFDLDHHKNDLGGTLDGMLREQVVLPESAWVRVPSHLSMQAAATLPCAAVTAWTALVERSGMRAGQTVLVLGTGGVSVFALQIATASGARVVVTSSDDAKLERAKQLGAAHTINYKLHKDWASEVWQWTNGQGVDHVVEVGGPGTLEQSMKAVAASGHIALIGVLTGFGAPNTSLFPLLARNINLHGIYVGPRDAFVRMNAFLKAHEIQPMIDRVYPFEDAPAAFAYLESAKHFGKVVIEI